MCISLTGTTLEYLHLYKIHTLKSDRLSSLNLIQLYLLEKFSVAGHQFFPVDEDHGHLCILHPAWFWHRLMENLHKNTHTPVQAWSSQMVASLDTVYIHLWFSQQDTCLSPPALSEGLPRISPQSGSAHGCNPVSSSPGGPSSPDCSGLHTLQRRRNTQEEG